MGFIAWILLGAIAGWAASVIMKTNASQGLLADIILGIAGSVVGGLVMNFFGNSGISGFNFYSLAVATFGAIILIGIGRMLYH